MPNGFGAVLSAMLITMFSFMGAEIVTIAAAESDTPDKHIVRATNSGDLAYLYFLSVLDLYRRRPHPMEYAGAEEHRLLPLGARAAAYIPYAKLIMDGVILLSVTSCLNSALYTASRMLYS